MLPNNFKPLRYQYETDNNLSVMTHYLLEALAAVAAMTVAFRVCFGLTPSSCKAYTTMLKYANHWQYQTQQYDEKHLGHAKTITF